MPKKTGETPKKSPNHSHEKTSPEHQKQQENEVVRNDGKEPEEFDENFFMLTQVFRTQETDSTARLPDASSQKTNFSVQTSPSHDAHEFYDFEEDCSTLSQRYRLERDIQQKHKDTRTQGKASAPKKRVVFDGKADWEIGDIIEGRYDVLELLGRGGMGVVYKVHHLEWNIDLAAKMPLPHLIADTDLKRRFLLEAQTWVDLGLHPNIVQCWYVRELGGIPRVFMDFLAGGSLKDWEKSGKIVPGAWDLILDIGIQACDGLGYAHENGVEAHRDVKPGNMLLTPEGELRITDFGLVKRAQSLQLEEKTFVLSSAGKQATVTTTGAGLGTPEYGAPEQWNSGAPVDERTDIYALGGVLFELCCGRRPFDDATQKVPPYALIGRHLFTPAPDPRTFHDGLPACLAEVILRCLNKEPEQRYASMLLLRAELVRCYETILDKTYEREAPQAAELRSSSLNNRAISLLDLGKKQEALTALSQALTFDAHHPESVYNKALLEWREEKIADDEVVRRLKEAKQASRRVGLYLGYIQLERAAADEAERELVEALEYPELINNNAAWSALGDALMAQEKYGEAKHIYHKALELLPEDNPTVQKIMLAQQRTRTQHGQILFPWPRCLRTFVGYTGHPAFVALSSDGHAALIGERDEFKLWDLQKGRYFWTCLWSSKLELWTFKGYAGSVTDALITSNGQYAVSGGSYDASLRIWDVMTGRCLRTLNGHTGDVSAIALTPDQNTVISASLDKTIRFWEIPGGRCLKTLEAQEQAVTALAVTPDGKTLLSGDGKFIRLWECSSGKYRRRFRGHKDDITALKVTPDGQFVISAGRDATLRLWKISSGKCVHVFVGHSGSVTGISVTPDGQQIVSSSTDKTLRIWNISSGRCLKILKGHAAVVTAVEVSPIGRLAISISRDKTLRLWSLTSGKCVKVYKEYTYWLEALALTADGRFALIGNHDELRLKALGKGVYAQRYTPSQTEVSHPKQEIDRPEVSRFWELPPGECFLTLKGRCDTHTAVSATHDGRFALSGSRQETLHLWDLQSEQTLWSFRGEQGLHVLKQQKNRFNCSAISFDGRFMVSGWSDESVRVWDMDSGTCRQTLKGHKKRVTAIAVTLDGRFALSGSLDRTLRMWNLASGQCLTVFEGHEGPLTSVAITPDARFAVSGSTDHTLRLWDVTKGKCLRTFKDHLETITAVSITSDGQLALSASSDKTLRLWLLDAKFHRSKASFQVCRQIAHGTLQAFKLRFRKYLRDATLAIQKGKPATAYTFLALARAVPGYERDPAALAFNAKLSRTLQRKQLHEGRLLKILDEHQAAVTSVKTTVDGRFALSGSRDHTLRLWTMMKGKCLRVFKGHRAEIVDIAVSPDRHFAVSASWDKTLRLWALATGECLKILTGHSDYVRCIAITPDGHFAVSGSNDHTLRLWSLLTESYLSMFKGLQATLEDVYKSAELTGNASLRVFRGHEAEVDAVAVTPNGRFTLSAAWDHSLRLWDINSGKCLRIFNGHTDYVTAVAIMPNGRFAISGSRDMTMRLWNVQTGKCLRVFEGHTGYISSIAITSDARFILSGSWDRSMRLWELRTGKCLRVFERHQDGVESVAITPDGHFALSGSRDGTVQIWEFDWELSPAKSR